MISNTDRELALLETLYASHEDRRQASQRELAGATGLSLGMTNALLKRFAERGWVKIGRMTSKSLRYALTPEGIAEISRRAVDYFRRAARNAGLYRQKIEAFVLAARAHHYETLILVGSPELDFLFDYSCERHGLSFHSLTEAQVLDALRADGSGHGFIYVWVERCPDLGGSGSVFIAFSDILSGSYF